MMKRFGEYIKKHPVRFGFLFGLIILFVLLITLRYIPAFSEFWTTTIGRWYQTVVGAITSFLPFSLFELLVIAAIAYLVVWIVLFVKKTKKDGIKQSSIKIVNILIVIFSVLTLYTGTAGMAYHRKPLHIPTLDTADVDDSQYYDVSIWAATRFSGLVEKLEYDDNGSVINPYSRETLCKLISDEYAKIDSDYFTKFTAKPKQLLLLGWLYTELNISGVSFLPTAEANYNQNIPALDIPFTIAHEIAHTKGVMNETEANNIAVYICLNSDDPYLQYSGFANCYEAMWTMAKTANDEDKMIGFYESFNPKIFKDFTQSNDFWDRHSLFKNIGDWFNNLYLKIFGGQGTDAYKDQVDGNTVIIDDKPTYVLNSLSPFQEVIVDLWLKENGQ